jgi:anti-anti-sigma regulatory factor
MAITDAGESIVVSRGAGRVTISVHGALEGAAVGPLLEAALTNHQPGVDLVVDMREVTMLGLDGVAALSVIRAMVRREEDSFLLRPPSMDVPGIAHLANLNTTPDEIARLQHPAGQARP